MDKASQPHCCCLLLPVFPVSAPFPELVLVFSHCDRGCSTVLEPSACNSLCQVLVPGNTEGWMTLHHEQLNHPPPPHPPVCAWSFRSLEGCFLLSA